MGSTLGLLRCLHAEGAGFILVGGMACIAHGASLATEDVDVCIPFTEANLERVLRALEGTQPRQRMTPGRPSLSRSASTYAGWRNLYVVTSEGQLDLLGERTGLGGYAALPPGAVAMDMGGFRCMVIGLEDLIRSKRAVASPKDLRAAVELEHVLRSRPVNT